MISPDAGHRHIISHDYDQARVYQILQLVEESITTVEGDIGATALNEGMDG